ncbi:fatty acid desaturase family protein [Cesiribacter andamanensis]|uniref:Fatty acid desaturase n=1 Tax=Cesiribacter andamanensis AMV16 TaxID=1279009 RepID=M7NGT2_9BACT|nr:acyl-CoA desaturase [Cesiribacter andamanensis]EMR01040.1 Fatty acid desaturase [Cesiribacter andamanensis AMV16]
MKKGHIKFVATDKNLFFATLRKRVDQHFKDKGISKHANSQMVIKTIALFALYLVPFAVLLSLQPPVWLSMLLWFLMGLGVAGIGMSIMHDANHGAYSSNKKVNELLGYSLNLVGGTAFNWKLQHNILHHTYTNVVHMDDDIADKLVLRFSPHTDVKGVHRTQFIHAFFFYGVLTLYWVLAKDFVQYVQYTRNGVNTNTPAQNAWLLTRIILNKVLYLAAIIGLPVLAGYSLGVVLAGFMLMHFVAGIVLTVVFQLAHTVEGTSHPLPTEWGTIENSWAIHQMNTTVNFSRHNKWISWYVGGLNFQVEHHLFPQICHVHYPEIAPIVKATAEEFGIPYLENETFMQAVRSHIATLQRFGLPAMNEAIV